MNNLTFGDAIKALKEDKKVAREGWNDKGMFIFMQIPSDIPISVVPNMQSLPQSVKDEFEERHKNLYSDSHLSIRYRSQVCIVYPDNTIYGWSPSPSDMFAEDWCIVD